MRYGEGTNPVNRDEHELRSLESNSPFSMRTFAGGPELLN